MPQTRRKLPRSFYIRPTIEVAPDLLGKYVIYNSTEGRLSAKIVEVEAYIGTDDPACHAARGKTNRNAVMFGSPGTAYIYFIYGMYHCLNFVTEPEGRAAAVLLRAAEPIEGLDLMRRRSPAIGKTSHLLNGPGKFCRSFGLTIKQNGLDLTGDTLYLEDRFAPVELLIQTTRIGINQGKEHLYRFYDAASEAVSRRDRQTNISRR